MNSTEKLQVMMPVPPPHKPKQQGYMTMGPNHTQVLRLSDDIDGREQFFSSRNAAQISAATTTAKKSQSVMRGVQTSRKNESLNVFPIQQTHVQRTL